MSPHRRAYSPSAILTGLALGLFAIVLVPPLTAQVDVDPIDSAVEDVTETTPETPQPQPTPETTSEPETQPEPAPAPDVVVSQSSQGISISGLLLSTTERLVWQAWIENDSEIYVFTGLDDPTSHTGYLLPAATLAQIDGRGPAIVQAIVPGRTPSKVAEVRINFDPTSDAGPASLPPDPEIMVVVGLRDGTAYANFVGISEENLGAGMLFPISGFKLQLDAQLEERLTAIEQNQERILAALGNSTPPVTEPDADPVVIYVNLDPWETLMELDGVGEAKARAAVVSRVSGGPIRNFDDWISRRIGMGPATRLDVEATQGYVVSFATERTDDTQP